MKLAIRILGAVEIFVGILFLAAMASDIQLGFGLVFICGGVSTFLAGLTK